MKARPNYSSIESVYGKPGDPKNFTQIELPFSMRLAWDLKQTVTKMTCHKLIANDLKSAFAEILENYGLVEIKKLGIDIFGGCLNVRQMRGSTVWSTHAWAIAIDLHPEQNQLKWGKDKALFAKIEYKPMIDIFEKYGFFNQGRYKGFDFQHFQAVRYV